MVRPIPGPPNISGSAPGWVFVEIDTDEGLRGVGECSNSPRKGNLLVGRALQTLRGFGVRFPDSRRADYCRYFVGVYAERLGRRTEAAIAYRSVEGNLRAVARARLARLESRPTSGLVLAFRKAWAARDSQTCAALVERMLRETPKDLMVTGGNAHFYRWVCAGRLGRTVEAIGHIDRFLARHPKPPSVDYSLYFKAVYLLRLGRHAVARQTLDRLDRDHPRSSLSQHAAALRARLPRR